MTLAYSDAISDDSRKSGDNKIIMIVTTPIRNGDSSDDISDDSKDATKCECDVTSVSEASMVRLMCDASNECY